jgi:hypothetical protein
MRKEKDQLGYRVPKSRTIATIDKKPKLRNACASCYFYRRYANQFKGECHRHAPGFSDDYFRKAWPDVDYYEWCGEYQLDNRVVLEKEPETKRKP